jgi:hypothetical protein
MGCMQFLVGCDAQHTPTDNKVAIQYDDNSKVNANVSVNSNRAESTAVAGTEKNNIIVETKSTAASITPDDQVVSTSGYQGLGFGQVVTPELLTDLGLTKDSSDNEQCYYVSDTKEHNIDQASNKRAAVLYQIIDGKVALISIQDTHIPLYTGIHVGDAVTSVMSAHDDSLTYEVDKYAVDGDFYSLIANVNFIVIGDADAGALLKKEDIKLNNANDTLPIQVEYHIKGGQKLSNNTISETEWTAENKRALQGEVDSIDIGIPEAIYLVEGCS